MNADLKKIEEEAFSLSAPERAHLAMSLIESLDNQDDANADALWLEEAERRYQAYREGTIQGRSADNVYRDAFAKVRL